MQTKTHRKARWHWAAALFMLLFGVLGQIVLVTVYPEHFNIHGTWLYRLILAWAIAACVMAYVIAHHVTATTRGGIGAAMVLASLGKKALYVATASSVAMLAMTAHVIRHT